MVNTTHLGERPHYGRCDACMAVQGSVWRGDDPYGRGMVSTRVEKKKGPTPGVVGGVVSRLG